GESLCGHWKAYAVAEAGGKTITCLQCRVNLLLEFISKSVAKCPRCASCSDAALSFLSEEPRAALPEHAECEWLYQKDDGIWRSHCGMYWSFDDGASPASHDVHFCGKCGKRLVVKP